MKRKLFALFILLVSGTTIGLAQRRLERLGRGVVAVRNGNAVFVSWRLLGLDPAGIGFNLYRSANGGAAVKLNTTVLTGGTNYTDNTATLSQSNTYYVRPVVNGTEQTAGSGYTLAANAGNKPCYTVPIRAGAGIHFAWVGDLDGDGEYDFVIDRIGDASGHSKIEAYKRDGSFLWDMDYGPNSENQDNISPGSATIDVGNWDGVTVYDLDGDGKAEVISKIANGVRFGDGTTWNNSSNSRQWIAVLNGQTGALKSYVSIPADYLNVGSLTCNLGIGYLDGQTPSIIGKFKNRNANGSFNLMVCAFKYAGSNTTLQWKWLRDTTNAPDGHQIRIIDVDGNGTDEVCDIGYCLNSNGTLRYSLGYQGVVHGDRTQIGKMDPNRAGMQGYGVQQNNPGGLLEYYYDARNGQILWKHNGSVADVGRGAAGDVDPNYSGFEVWSFFGLYNGPSNTQITPSATPYPNFRIWWDGDVLSENLHEQKIEKWNHTSATVSRLVTCWNHDSAVGSDRGAPLFYGDIMGDWREEVVLCNLSHNKLIVFTTPTTSATRLYTLAHNPAYRNGMTIKGYMQSHQLDYFLGSGMAAPAAPAIYYAGGTAPALRSTTNHYTLAAGSSNPTTPKDPHVAGSFQLFPNPVTGNTLTIQYPFQEAATAYVTLSDMKGQVLLQKQWHAAKAGSHTTTIHLSNSLPAGTYIAGINIRGAVQSKVFTVERR